jgi:hypothetical protein
MKLSVFLWELLYRFLRVLLLCAVFALSSWACHVESVQFSGDYRSAQVQRRVWDWPEGSILFPLVAPFMVDYFIWVAQGAPVVMCNIVQGSFSRNAKG